MTLSRTSSSSFSISISTLSLSPILLLLFISFISAQVLPTLNFPYSGSSYGSGGATPVTLTSTSGASCRVRVPVTIPEYSYQYTTPEFFVIFLSSATSINSYQIWASWNAQPPTYGYSSFANPGAFTLGYGNYGTFVQIPPTVVSGSNVDATNHTTIFFGSTTGYYSIVVNASVAVPQLFNTYSGYNQTTFSVQPYTAEVVKFTSSYSAQSAYFFELCTGNLTSSTILYNAGVYMFWPPNSYSSNTLSTLSTMNGPAIPSGAVSYNNYVTTGLDYIANFTIPFNSDSGWSWTPLIVSSNTVYSSNQGYAILTNTWNPYNTGMNPPNVVYRSGFWASISYVPYASSQVNIATYEGGLVLQINFASGSCIGYGYSLDESNIEVYFIDDSYPNNNPNIAGQGCFAQENSDNDQIYSQVASNLQVSVDSTNSIVNINIPGNWNSYQGNQVAVSVNTTECGYITFAPVTVPYGSTAINSPSIGNWKVLVPTIFTIFFAFIAILLTIKVAALKGRLERGEHSNEPSYEPILDGRTAPPLATSATAPLVSPNYAPNYNYISYNPNPTNRGNSPAPSGGVPPVPPMMSHPGGLAGPQVVYSATTPSGNPNTTATFPQASLALYGIPPSQPR